MIKKYKAFLEATIEVVLSQDEYDITEDCLANLIDDGFRFYGSDKIRNDMNQELLMSELHKPSTQPLNYTSNIECKFNKDSIIEGWTVSKRPIFSSKIPFNKELTDEEKNLMEEVYSSAQQMLNMLDYAFGFITIFTSYSTYDLKNYHTVKIDLYKLDSIPD